MRLGCSGCLATVLLAGLLAVLTVTVIGAGVRMLARPTPDVVTSSADGARAQRKLTDLARHERRGQVVVFTEGEVNALLTNHLVEVRGVRISGLTAHLLGGNRLELTARTPLRRLLDEVPGGLAADALPASWQARPVQLTVGARLTVDGDSTRQLRVDVDRFAVGRQRLPTLALRLLADPATIGLLRWRLPDHVESVAIEPGRVVIRTRP